VVPPITENQQQVRIEKKRNKSEVKKIRSSKFDEAWTIKFYLMSEKNYEIIRKGTQISEEMKKDVLDIYFKFSES
jgi:hypothetical protein